ncbi:ATP-dependent DNA helicase PcrA [Candidatus Parcubacteria bacterium]|nr:MAG: ATP-dependent DNA helicase PcrA [Candidatus Parcubacteria bacterium]
MPSSNILNKLNAEQRAAVASADGPSIVLAGAGSGKTRVLVYKVLYLILEKKVDPSNILMSTFTNKAAGEMLERIIKLLKNENILLSKNQMPTVGTFHSLCARILRRDGKNIGIPNSFLIYDQQDQLDLVKQSINFLDMSAKEVKARSILNAISGAKNEMITPQLYASVAHGYFQENAARIYLVYQEKLKENDALDFDDLLLETIRLFKTDPFVLEKYQDKFLYILVDEYQDTNVAQYQLTKFLSAKNRNVCVVGDFSQSIYSFRGADFRNLDKFKKDFPEAKTFSLSQNYRSTQKILDAAYSVISKNESHPILSLWTENPEGEEISIFEVQNEHDEGELIISKILEQKSRNPHFSLRDVAVLYRMNAQSRALEEVFLHNSLPYILIGGTRFYERKEVKDALSYLSFLANQKDSVALKRIEKLGKRRMMEFIKYVEEFNKNGYITNKATIEILDEVMKKTSYLSLYDESIAEDKARLENLKELRSVAIEFTNLIQFLENVALVEQEYLPDRKLNSSKNKVIGEEIEAVTFMTLHAAKGLEFKMVFMVGMEEGLFPHSQSFFDKSELEEERRLCYVGITRAKEKLFLTYAKNRLFFGQRNSNMPSRFIFELPEEVREYNLVDQFDNINF